MRLQSSFVRRSGWLALPVVFVCLGGRGVMAVGPAPSPIYKPSGEWEAFFRNEKGSMFAMLQPVELNKDKDWMYLQFTNYAGPKLRLAVMGVENKTATAEQANTSSATVLAARAAEVPVASLQELMTTAVLNTHRFEVMERKAIEQVLGEQDLGSSGRVHKGTGAETGRLLGVQYMLWGAVNEWTPDKDKAGGAGAARKGLLRGLGVEQTTAEVAISFRVVDASTSQVLFATTERATSGSWGVNLGGLLQGNGGTIGFKSRTPIDYAVQACINKGVYKLAMWLKDRPWSGRVIRVAGSKVYINAGSNNGLANGLVLSALSRGKELIDPGTGVSLGVETEAIGTLQVVEVFEKYAVAAVMQGCRTLKEGDQVELQTSR